MNNNAVISDSFSFRINDVTTGEVLPRRETGNRDSEYNLHTFRMIPLEDYPMFTYYVRISSVDGELYLQYVFDSDYYKITDEFANALYQNGYLS